MLHLSERLPFDLEAGEHALGVHPELDDLQRDAPPYRHLLLGEVDGPHPTLAEDADDLERADLLGSPAPPRVETECAHAEAVGRSPGAVTAAVRRATSRW